MLVDGVGGPCSHHVAIWLVKCFLTPEGGPPMQGMAIRIVGIATDLNRLDGGRGRSY